MEAVLSEPVSIFTVRLQAWHVLGAVTVWERLVRHPALARFAPNEDSYVVSGDALESRRLHTLVTCNFIHGGASHMVSARAPIPTYPAYPHGSECECIYSIYIVAVRLLISRDRS